MKSKLVHAVFAALFVAAGIGDWLAMHRKPKIDCGAVVADITIFDHGKPLGTAKGLDLVPSEHGCAIADGEP